MLTKSDVDILSTLPEIKIPESRDVHEILSLLKPIKIHGKFFILDWAIRIDVDSLLPAPVLPVGQITNRENAYVVVGLERDQTFIDCIRIDNRYPQLPVPIPGFTQYFNTKYTLDHWDISFYCNDDLKEILLTTPEYRYEVFYRTGTNSFRSDPINQEGLRKILPDTINVPKEEEEQPTPPAVKLGRTEKYIPNGAEFKFNFNEGAIAKKKICLVQLAEVIRTFDKSIEEGKLVYSNKLEEWLDRVSYDFLDKLNINDMQVVKIKEDKDVFANVYLGSVSSEDTQFILDIYLQLVDSKSMLEAKRQPGADAPETCIRLCALRVHKDMKYSPDIACTVSKYLEQDDKHFTLEKLIEVTSRVEYTKGY